MKRKVIWLGAERLGIKKEWLKKSENKWQEDWWKMAGLGEDADMELVISIVDKDVAKKLNRKWRNRYYVPQVLAFINQMDRWEDGWVRPGDIVICADKLMQENRKFGKNIDEILVDWVLHGWKNLIGQGE